jgi:uncharacterized membrane protein YbaN (DUF454 family)
MLEQLGSIHSLLPPAVGVLALLVGALIIDLIAKRVLVGSVRAFAKRSSVTWDDALVTHNVFGRLVQDRSPLPLLNGFGAMTAILLLVFKDTILSLVASVQLTAQDMVRVGDWIEMPQFGADGGLPTLARFAHTHTTT